jgi:polyphosphate kinase 2 (PPK2 family)
VRKGKKLVRVAKGSKTVGRGKTVTIRLKLNNKALAAIRKSIVKGKAKVVLTVTGVDAAGNRTVVKKTIRVG